MKRKTLLVIDDDAIFNDLLRRQLDAMGFNSVGAGSWSEARKRLEEIEPDAIILDFKLPDTDAAKALAELRNQYPVIVLTGYGSIPNAVSAIREGAADFLTKPVNLDELELRCGACWKTPSCALRTASTAIASLRSAPAR